jgi:hypothetical protein
VWQGDEHQFAEILTHGGFMQSLGQCPDELSFVPSLLIRAVMRAAMLDQVKLAVFGLLKMV